jgi:hypothetical protein
VEEKKDKENEVDKVEDKASKTPTVEGVEDS